MPIAVDLYRTRADTAVARALRDASRESVEFPEQLANHLPMILVALDRLGADEDRLHEYAHRYRTAKGLVAPPEPIEAVTAETWKRHLGDRARESDYRAFFVAEVQRLGIRRALAAYFGTLADGIAASALHGLMRLAYALLREDPIEVGHSLGYIATTYLPAPPIVPLASDPDPGALLRAVSRLPGIEHAVPAYLLWRTIESSYAAEGFAAASQLSVDDETLPRLTSTSLALYARSNCFSSLHVLTGTFWVRVALPYLGIDDGRRLLLRYWQAILAVIPKIAVADLLAPAAQDALRRGMIPDWADIAAAAVASDDEHDLSLVYSAFQEDAVHGDPLYRYVAARRVGLT